MTLYILIGIVGRTKCHTEARRSVIRDDVDGWAMRRSRAKGYGGVLSRTHVGRASKIILDLLDAFEVIVMNITAAHEQAIRATLGESEPKNQLRRLRLLLFW
jgi:hypothetical protein